MRFVAIKLVHGEKLSDAERKRRFVQEAKTASALNHPNILTIYDIDEADGLQYIAMAFPNRMGSGVSGRGGSTPKASAAPDPLCQCGTSIARADRR